MAKPRKPKQPTTQDRVRAALAAIAAGPSAEDLAQAPCLDNWYSSGEKFAYLEGTVHDHPELTSDRPIYTSAVLAIDAHAKWARTISRWYRLGTPADATVQILPGVTSGAARDAAIAYSHAWAVATAAPVEPSANTDAA